MLGAQQLAKTAHCRLAIELFRTATRPISKRFAFQHTTQKPFAKEAVHRRHDGAVSLPDGSVLQYFADSGRASFPDCAVYLPLQRAEWCSQRAFEIGIVRIHS